MRRFTLVLAFATAMASPAEAHRLKVFATVEEGAVAGFGFFVGGGRPNGATVIIRETGGREAYRGLTGPDGRYSWRPPGPADFTVIIDTREGHMAEAQIRAERFAGAPDDPTPAMPAPAAGDQSGPSAAAADLGANAEGCALGVDGASLASLVDRAVARQVRPLLESHAAAEGRIRFNDVAGGFGMIAGLAGLGLWAGNRRRDRTASPPGGG